MRTEASFKVAFGSLAFLIAGLLLLGGRQVMTGDEPRYFLYARSFIEHARLVMTLPEWQATYLANTGLEASGYPVGANDVVLMHSVYLTTLLSPFALLGLSGLRAVTLLAGLSGLACLLALCRGAGSRGAALIATSVAGLSIPLLPYLHLFYMETFLFTLVTAGWMRLQRPARGLRGDMATAVLLLAIPFVHLRGAVVAAALYSGLIARVYQAGRPSRAAGLAALGLVALAIMIAANLAIYGAVTGPVNTARPPLPAEVFHIVAMQWFNVRHGLLAYAPVWLLGYAGLIAGSLKQLPIARQGLVLAVIAGITGMGVNPGECWPARFWVLSVPMLAVGLCVWWELGRAWLLRGLAVALIGFTLINTVIFIAAPNRLVENREASFTYQRLFDKLGVFDFGLPLPVETDDPADKRAAALLAAGALLFIAFASAAAVRAPGLALPAIALLVAVLDLSRVAVVPSAAYTLDRGPGRLGLAFEPAASVGYVQIGRYWEQWFEPPAWPRFDVRTVGVAGSGQRRMPANQVVPIACAGPIRSVEIVSPAGLDLEAEAAARLVVYQSRSLIRQWAGLPSQPC